MVFSISNIKEQSRYNLEGKYFRYFLMLLPLFIISLAIELFGLFDSGIIYLAMSLLSSIFMNIYCHEANLNIALGEDKFVPQVERVIGVTIKAFVLSLLISLIIVLGFILFIIPGIIASFALSQAFYILIEDNSKSVIECIAESVNIMKGNKLNLFILNMSYLPELILCIITLGIAAFWMIPRIDVALAHFYIHTKDCYYNRVDNYNDTIV